MGDTEDWQEDQQLRPGGWMCVQIRGETILVWPGTPEQRGCSAKRWWPHITPWVSRQMSFLADCKLV
jgi:hypothetical protein